MRSIGFEKGKAARAGGLDRAVGFPHSGETVAHGVPGMERNHLGFVEFLGSKFCEWGGIRARNADHGTENIDGERKAGQGLRGLGGGVDEVFREIVRIHIRSAGADGAASIDPERLEAPFRVDFRCPKAAGSGFPAGDLFAAGEKWAGVWRGFVSHRAAVLRIEHHRLRKRIGSVRDSDGDDAGIPFTAQFSNGVARLGKGGQRAIGRQVDDA